MRAVYIQQAFTPFTSLRRSSGFSRGHNRVITVYKKDASSLAWGTASFTLQPLTQQAIATLLHQFAVTPGDRQQLLPSSERDRVLNEGESVFFSFLFSVVLLTK